MKNLIRLTLLGLLVFSSTQTIARAGEDPVDILKKADAASKAVDAVAYETEFEGLGESAAQAPKIKAKLKNGARSGGRSKYFLVDLWVTEKDSEKAKYLTFGSDGEEFYVIDHHAKKAYVDIDPAVVGKAGQWARMASVAELGHETPFSDEINAKKQELLGTCEVSGEAGYEIHVVYANGMQEATWCFSKKTHLPRKRVDKMNVPGRGERSQQRTVTKLEVLDSINEDEFKFKLPEGYERIDDFYPD